MYRVVLFAALTTTCAAHTDRVLPPCDASPAIATSSEPTIVAVGDVAQCNGDGRQRDVAALVDRIRPDAVFALGDLAYEDGTIDQFLDCYGPSLGRFRPITRAVVGNHEYHTPHAGAYYAYFCGSSGAAFQGWYAFDVGTWHVIALNSNCGGDLDVPAEVATEFGGCDDGSPQAQWLRADLAAHPSRCTLAMWHHPRHSSSSEGPTAAMQPIFAILANAGVDVVLNGHAHAYERFPPMLADGTPDANGMRVFIVGTGGSTLSAFGDGPVKSDIRDDGSHGVLRMTLRDGSYAWSFEPIDGDTFRDAGESRCHD